MRTRSFCFMIALSFSGLTGCAADAADSDGPDVDTSEEALARGRTNREGFHEIPSLTEDERATILAKYSAIDHEGIRDALYESAILYYDTNLDRIPNKSYLSIVDFSLHSAKRRFYVLDMTGGPLQSIVTAHGKMSDEDNDGYATSFSNVSGSNKSSVGFYFVAEEYSGRFGVSVRLDGLSTTNSNVRDRAIVIHGSDYVYDGRPQQGRSLGCFALSWDDKPGIVTRLQNGSVLYASN